MRHNHAINLAARRNGELVHNPIDWATEKFEAGDERDIEIATLKLPAKGGWMIKINVSGPAVNQRASIKIFDAANAQHLSRAKGGRALTRRRRIQPPPIAPRLLLHCWTKRHVDNECRAESVEGRLHEWRAPAAPRLGPAAPFAWPC